MDEQTPRHRSFIDFNLSTIVKVVGVIAAIWLGWNILIAIFPIIIWLIAALFFAVALNPAVSRIANWLPSPNRAVATGIAFVLVLGVLVVLLGVTLPPIASQIIDFFTNSETGLPAIYADFITQDNFFANLINNYELNDDISNFINNIGSRLAGSQGTLTGLLNLLFSFAINVIGVLVLTFMMLVEGPRLIKQATSLARSPEQLARWERVGRQMYEVVASYINGQLLIAVIAGSASLLVMSLVGDVPNPLAMAGIVAIMSLIPLVGATVAAVIVVASTLLVSVKGAIIMAIFFIVYQQIENATIQPHIQSRSLNLSAMMVFIVAIVGARLGGIWGAILAVPAAGCIRVLIVDYFQHSPRYQSYVANRQAALEASQKPKPAKGADQQKDQTKK